MKTKSYLDEGFKWFQAFSSQEKSIARADCIFSMSWDFMFFIMYICLLLVACLYSPSNSESEYATIVVAVSASLITITILVNAHICKSHVFDTSSEGLTMLSKLKNTYNEDLKNGVGDNWCNPLGLNILMEQLHAICFHMRRILLQYNIRIIIIWTMFIFTVLLLITAKNTISSGLFIFWFFFILYTIYTFITMFVIYNYEANVRDYLHKIYSLKQKMESIPDEAGGIIGNSVN